MEFIERAWELTGNFFSGLTRGIERGITSLFGSSNARYLRKLQPLVAAINELEPKYQAMSDAQLREQTNVFRQRLADGATLDDLLVEAFAVCREAGRRYLGMRHYDVQLLGGMVLHNGGIAEMITGEGKTLVATLPAYLNALVGRGVHVVTVNDYLARRDREWMGPLYMGLGLSVGAIQAGMETLERQQQYACDITYGTNNEFGFDYLRDNMKIAARGDDRFPKFYQQAQGPLYYAIVDEVDNILIDEARTPLIISGPAHDDVSRYPKADAIARQLKRDLHFEVKEKEHTCHLTEEGVREAERLAGVESFYTAGNTHWPHLIDNALKAHHLYKRDVNYVVKDGQVIIVDEFTGRLMPGRQWSDGLHQAVEAKEGVQIKEETQTLATITLQNFFKLYEKICGMTGTAMTEASEFWKIYKLDVVAIPPNRPLQRINHPDVIYRSEREKFEAIAQEIERLNKWDVLLPKGGEEIWGTILRDDEDSLAFQPKGAKSNTTYQKSALLRIERKGRPVLVGTTSIEKSERLSAMLDRRGIKHQVLNAKHHEREAEIVAQAGRKFAVTIATNMAGRGTDIILGGNPEAMAWSQLQHKYATRLDVPQEEWEALVNEIEAREQTKKEGREVAAMGGLHVIGTERHEARRIDLQLRGRCGRQGDPGSSRFYLSLEDDLMRIFAGEWVKNVLTRLGMQEGEAIESKIVTRRIEGAQRKVEERNFDIRKNLLEYDEVMDEQRKRVYGYRQKILQGIKCKKLILEMIESQIDEAVDTLLDKDYGLESLVTELQTLFGCSFDVRDFRGMDYASAMEFARDEAQRVAESQVQDDLEENLPSDEDESEWNWEALTKVSNRRWKIQLRDHELKKLGRDGAEEFLLEKSRQYVQAVDTSSCERYFAEDYGLHSACSWARHQFNIEVDPQEAKALEPEAFQELLRAKAAAAYEEKEIEYPVLAGLYRFTVTSGGQKRFDREGLAHWAAQRFRAPITDSDLRGKQRSEVFELLKQHSAAFYRQGLEDFREAQQRLEDGQAESPQRRAELAAWLRERFELNVSDDELAQLGRDDLLARLDDAFEERYRAELARMERALVLQLLDEGWKEHLLTMDHLRSSIGLSAYAQQDPKVEYKKEGMRLFDRMWQAVGQRVTQLVFRMEQLDERFVGSTWVETRATHAEAASPLEMAAEAQQIADGSDAAAKLEPIRNRAQRVGRNDPCPCGSGKKFKNCCMRNQVPAAKA